MGYTGKKNREKPDELIVESGSGKVLLPPIKFVIKREKPLEEIRAKDIPSGLTARDIAKR